jgi:hypothetical protein
MHIWSRCYTPIKSLQVRACYQGKIDLAVNTYF